MPTYLAPGVYFEELSRPRRLGRVEGFSERGIDPFTSSVPFTWHQMETTAGFVGMADKGSYDDAVLLTDWDNFGYSFGSFVAGSCLAHAVYGYFANGGRRCYVVRVDTSDGRPPSLTLGGIDKALRVLERASEVTTICAPDISAAHEAV